MITLHHTKLTAALIEATTSRAGYGAANLATESLGKPWRAEATGAEELRFTLADLSFIQTLFVHDVNFASAPVEKSVDGVVWVAVGDLVTHADRHGRRRGFITIAAAGQLSVRILIAAGAASDGLAYWRGGAGYLFAEADALSAAPDYGYSVVTKRPRVSTELANGVVATATTGLNRDRIELNFPRLNTEMVDDLVQKATAGTCLLDMKLPNYPEQLWPVRSIEAEVRETFTKKNLSALAVPLIEIA